MLVSAWVAGSTALLVLGLGVGLAAIVASGWQAIVARRLSVVRLPLEAVPVEGDSFRLRIEVRGPRWLASSLVWRDRLGSLGDRSASVAADGSAVIVAPALPRGRYRVGPGSLLAVDPLGLGRAVVAPDRAITVTVRPRVPEPSRLFTERGARGVGSRRAPRRRSSGLEPRGVREYVEGEPLRAVHWPSSARRDALMVRELDDARRERVAVVLDVDAAGVVGRQGDTSLDDAVRAAAAVVRAHAVRARHALLVIGTPEPVVHRVGGLGRDWELALDALAAVEGCRAPPLASLLTSPLGLDEASDLVVVTARPESVADALAARAAYGRPSALVAVDAATYAGRPPARAAPALLRLAGAGVALAVLRHGTPVAAALEGVAVSAVG